MTNFTQTLTVSVRFFGNGPASLWNAYNWGAFNWGEGTADIRTQSLHLISESLTPTSDPARKNVFHLLDGETLTLTSDDYRYYGFTVGSTLSIDADMGSEGLRDGSGYLYVFPDRTSEAEDRSFASWTQGSASSSTWTTAGAAATTWSST